jgi:hypothetical protein
MKREQGSLLWRSTVTRIPWLVCRNMTISISPMVVTSCLSKHHLRRGAINRTQSDLCIYRPHFPRALRHSGFVRIARHMLVSSKETSQFFSLTTVLSCPAAFLLLARTLRSTVLLRSTPDLSSLFVASFVLCFAPFRVLSRQLLTSTHGRSQPCP